MLGWIKICGWLHGCFDTALWTQASNPGDLVSYSSVCCIPKTLIPWEDDENTYFTSLKPAYRERIPNFRAADCSVNQDAGEV